MKQVRSRSNNLPAWRREGKGAANKAWPLGLELRVGLGNLTDVTAWTAQHQLSGRGVYTITKMLCISRNNLTPIQTIIGIL